MSLKYEVKSPAREPRIIFGRFQPNGISALVAAETIGHGFSAARSGVGTFQITLDESYGTYVGCVAMLQLNTADNWFMQAYSYDSSTRVLTLKIIDATAAAAAELAHHANNIVHFAIFCQA